VRGRLPALDGLRGLAILLVLVLHLWRPERSTLIGPMIGHVTRLGWVGVDLFFVLSGFLITGILIEARGKAHYFRNFFARRVLRIFPLYYLFLVASLVLMPLFVEAMQLDRFPGYQYAADAGAWPWFAFYVSNLWMVIEQNFSSGYANSLTWSLAIEEQFYLVWPLLILVCPPRHLLRLMAAVVCTAVALRAILALAGGSWLTIFLLTPCRLDCLAIGGLLAAYLRSPRFDPQRWQRLSRWGLFGCLPAAFVWLLIAGDGAREEFLFQVVGYTLLACGWAGLLARVVADGEGRLGRLFRNRALISLGKYSYGLYLFHLLGFVFVYPLVYRWVLDLTGHPLLERLFWLLAGIAGSWLLAFTLYHLYEVRFLRLKRFFRAPGALPAPRPARSPAKAEVAAGAATSSPR